MRLDGLGIDAGEQRVYVSADLYVLNAVLGEDAGQHVAAGAVHAVDAELEAGAGDSVEISKLRDRGDIRLFEVGRLDRSLLAAGHGT